MTTPKELAQMRRSMGRELRASRKDAGYSQADLARKIECSQPRVSQAEAGIPGSREFWAAADQTLDTAGALTAAYDKIARCQAPLPPTPDDLVAAVLGNGDLEFVTVKEMAALTRLSKMTIYRALEAGDLERRRFGRSIRIPVESARHYLTSTGY